MVVSGTSFGISPRVSIGGVPCVVNTTTIDQDQIACTAGPRLGWNTDVIVTVAGRASNAVPLQFVGPELSQIVPNVINANGGFVLFQGQHFGITDVANFSIVIGNHQCENVQLLAGTTLRCHLKGPVPSADVPVRVRAWGVWTEDLAAEIRCAPEFYGEIGDLCSVCPTGAVCLGLLTAPVAERGYFQKVCVCLPLHVGGYSSSVSHSYAGLCYLMV